VGLDKAGKNLHQPANRGRADPAILNAKGKHLPLGRNYIHKFDRQTGSSTRKSWGSAVRYKSRQVTPAIDRLQALLPDATTGH